MTQLSVPIYDITSLERKMTAYVIPNAIQITTRQNKYTFASFLSRDTTFDVIYNIWRLARPTDTGSIASGRGSLDVPMVPGTEPQTIDGALVPAAAIIRKATQCTCGKEGQHFSETALDVVIPGTPERIHNLIFASGFMKDFMAVNQKLFGMSYNYSFPLLRITKFPQTFKWPTGLLQRLVPTCLQGTCLTSSHWAGV